MASNNNITLEISNRLMSANKAYFGLINHFKSRLLSRKRKIILYKTLIKSVLTYVSETWVLTKDDERRFGVFKRRILRRIAGPIFENGIWRRRFNREIYEMLNDCDIINFIKINRLRWAGHVARMDDKEIIKRILNSNPGGQRGRGRPKLRWIDGVEHDLRKIGCKNWKIVAQNRRCWRHLLEEARAHPGL